MATQHQTKLGSGRGMIRTQTLTVTEAEWTDFCAANTDAFDEYGLTPEIARAEALSEDGLHFGGGAAAHVIVRLGKAKDWMATSTGTRYLVSWAPAATVEARCRARGMKDGDGTGFWDWVDPGICTVSTYYETFSEAEASGRAVLPLDVSGQVRIARERLIQSHDDLGHACRERIWEEDAVWYIDGPAALSEIKPDFTP